MRVFVWPGDKQITIFNADINPTVRAGVDEYVGISTLSFTIVACHGVWIAVFMSVSRLIYQSVLNVFIGGHVSSTSPAPFF